MVVVVLAVVVFAVVEGVLVTELVTAVELGSVDGLMFWPSGGCFGSSTFAQSDPANVVHVWRA